MLEYIDREAFVATLRNDPLFDLVGRYGIVSVIEAFPAADVVSVVRCKDCRFARFGPEWIICENFNGLCTTALGLEDFCSHGERRQQDGRL